MTQMLKLCDKNIELCVFLSVVCTRELGEEKFSSHASKI